MTRTTMILRPLLSVALGAVISVVGTGMTYGEQVAVLGNLRAIGSIEVVAGAGAEPLSVAGTSYAYAAGDRIRTGSGKAVLSIEGLGRIGFGPATEASVARSESETVVEMTKGALGYVLSPSANVRIRVQGIELKPGQPDLREVSTSGEHTISGWVVLDENGRLDVSARSGAIEVRAAQSRNFVRSGERVLVAMEEGRLVLAQAAGAATAGAAGAGGGAGAGIGGLSGLQVLAIAAVVGGIAAGVAVSSGDGDEQPVSP